MAVLRLKFMILVLKFFRQQFHMDRHTPQDRDILDKQSKQLISDLEEELDAQLELRV